MKTVVKKYGEKKSIKGMVLKLDDELVYQSHRKREKHFMRKYMGWGLDIDIYEELKKMGVKLVHIEVEGEGILQCELKDFEDKGVMDRIMPFNEQYFLQETFMRWVEVY